MLDHDNRKLLGWVCGDRDTETGQKIIPEDCQYISKIYADNYAAYPEIAGAIPLVTGKENTVQIERNIVIPIFILMVAKIVIFEQRSAVYVKVHEQRKRRKLQFAAHQNKKWNDYNGYQRRWLACFHRRSMVVTRSLEMLEARMKL